MNEVRELNDADLDMVSGAEWNDSNYKFCWNGPAGEGLYPWYTNCNEGGGASYGTSDLANDMAGAVAGAMR
jgi:hypothetical protein